MEIIVRAAITFLFLWVVTRGMGKRQLAEMSPFELILLVTLGDLVQQGVTGNDHSFTGSVLAVGTITFLVLVSSYVSYRSKRFRSVLDGAPLVLVDRTALHEDRMHWERLTVEDLREEARGQGIASLDEIRFAVLEPDGNFSFLTDDKQPKPPDGEAEPEDPGEGGDSTEADGTTETGAGRPGG